MGNRKGSSALVRPDGPFGALAGPSRRAAWRRTLLRRVLSGALILIAVALVLTRPGPLRSVARTPSAAAPTHSAGGLLDPTGSRGDADALAAGGTGGASPGTGGGVAGGGGAAYGAGGSGSAGLGVVTLGGLRGATTVPAGSVGVSMPILDPTMAARLRVGDVVDAYAPGSTRAAARNARVLDVIGVKDTRSGASGADDPSSPGVAVAAAFVFLAVSRADVARITAGQPAEGSPGGFWLAVRGSGGGTASVP
ncbi:MAG: hypothetical protein U0Q21_04755 [Dermatophilaceae bacterium]